MNQEETSQIESLVRRVVREELDSRPDPNRVIGPRPEQRAILSDEDRNHMNDVFESFQRTHPGIAAIVVHPVCEKCQGVGRLQYPVHGDEGSTTWLTCPACNGTARAPTEINIPDEFEQVAPGKYRETPRRRSRQR